jgi:hypothetical protein
MLNLAECFFPKASLILQRDHNEAQPYSALVN